MGSGLWANSATGQPYYLGLLFSSIHCRKLSSPHLVPSLKFLLYLCLSLSLPRKKLPLHHLVHRRNLPPCDLGDSLCMLETLQKVWVTPQVPHPEFPNSSIHPNPKLSSFLRFKCLSPQGPEPLPRRSISPLCIVYRNTFSTHSPWQPSTVNNGFVCRAPFMG